MQWDDTANHGFSTADAQDIYLPVDTAADAPTVAAQADDPDSLLNSVKSLLAFRHAHADLNADAPFKVLYAPKAKDDYRPFVWQRGDLICAVNPAGCLHRAAAGAGRGSENSVHDRQGGDRQRHAVPGRTELCYFGIRLKDAASDGYKKSQPRFHYRDCRFLLLQRFQQHLVHAALRHAVAAVFIEIILGRLPSCISTSLLACVG